MITTHTGHFINPLTMTEKDVDIRDIAHALSQVNRFAGHTREPLNVAQHSVYVSRLCRDTPYRLQALLHDASEAYVGDVTFLLKRTPEFAAYREIEARIERLVYRTFGVSEVMGEEVHAADRLMARFEGRQGYGKDWQVRDAEGNVDPSYGPLTDDELARIGRWKVWDWKWSKDIFLAEYRMALAADLEAQKRMADVQREVAREVLLAEVWR